MIKRMIIMLVVVGAVLAGVFGFKIFDDGQVKAFMASMGNLPQTVSTTKVVRSDWQPKLQAVGSLKQHAGKSKREAIEIAAGIRLRPILMTTAAMVLGVIPLITATGAGALSRFSMGLVIASGMALGTLFTLFVVPAVYVMLAADHSKTGQAEEAGAISPAE